MVLTKQFIYLVNIKTMRRIFSNYVCFFKSPNFTRRICHFFPFLEKRLSTIYLKYHEMKKGIIFNTIQNVQNFSKPISIQIKPLWKATCIASRHARWAKQWPAKNNLGMSKNRSLQWIKILSEEAVLFLCISDFTGYLQVNIFQKFPFDCHFIRDFELKFCMR